MGLGVPDPVGPGRRHDLTAGDFAALATTAYLLGRRNDCIQALQRAYQANVDRGDVLAAVRSALWLATVLYEGGEGAIGDGWVARAQRLLDEVDGDVVECGYLLQMQGFGHLMKGEFAKTAALAPQASRLQRGDSATQTCWPSLSASRAGSRSTPGESPPG